MIFDSLPQKQHAEFTRGILVVDDNNAVLSSVKELLELHGYRVYTKQNANSALNFLHSSKDKVNLIISDIRMPDQNGFEFYSQLQDNEEMKQFPFIVLSVVNSHDEIQKAKELGIDDFVTKPFIPQDLLACVKGKIQKFETAKQYVDNQISGDRKRIIQTITHELRTPLVLVSTGSELLKEQLQNQTLTNQSTITELIDSISRGAQDLDRKIEDFLIVQQLEFNTAQIKKQISQHTANVNFSEVIQEAIGQFLENFKNSSSDAHNSIPKINFSISATCKNTKVKISSSYVVDAIQRILSNAYKFGNNEKNIDVTIKKDKTNDKRIFCTIRDYGSGFSKNTFIEACKELSQINREKSEQQGLGLGLSIARRYIVLNGGTVEYRTPSRGNGSIIRVGFKSV